MNCPRWKLSSQAENKIFFSGQQTHLGKLQLAKDQTLLWFDTVSNDQPKSNNKKTLMHVYANWLQTALVQLQNTTVTMISTGHLTREYLICCEDAKKDCITLYYHDIIMPPRKESHPRASQSDLRI